MSIKIYVQYDEFARYWYGELYDDDTQDSIYFTGYYDSEDEARIAAENAFDRRRSNEHRTHG